MVRKIRWICARWEIGLPARHANGCSEVHCKYKRKGKGRRQGQFRKEKKKKQENKYSTGLDLIPGSCPQTRDAIWTAMYSFRDRSHMTSGKRTARHFCNASLLPNNRLRCCYSESASRCATPHHPALDRCHPLYLTSLPGARFVRDTSRLKH